MRAAHEGSHHLLGGERMTEVLRRQFRTDHSIACRNVVEGELVEVRAGHVDVKEAGHEFHVSWVNTYFKTWLPYPGNERLQKVKDYCAAHGLDMDAMDAHTKKQKRSKPKK